MKKTPIFSIKPKLSSNVLIIQSLIFSIPAIFLFTFFLGTILLIFLTLTGVKSSFDISGISSYIFSLYVGMAIFPIIFYEIKRHNYGKTYYHFFEDYVDFQQFGILLNRKAGRIHYIDILDMVQKANFLQQTTGTTSLYLSAPETAFVDEKGFVGLRIDDVPVSQGLVRKVRSILDGELGASETDHKTPEETIVKNKEKNTPKKVKVTPTAKSKVKAKVKKKTTKNKDTDETTVKNG